MHLEKVARELEYAKADSEPSNVPESKPEDGHISGSENLDSDDEEFTNPSRVSETPEYTAKKLIEADEITQAQTKTNNSLEPIGLMGCSDEDDSNLAFPPGFTPSQEELAELRTLMEEGVSMIPLEHQSDFLHSVDNAKDGEILDFFREKFKDPNPAAADTNYITHHNLRRSPRIKKNRDKFAESTSISGLKRDFLNDQANLWTRFLNQNLGF